MLGGGYSARAGMLKRHRFNRLHNTITVLRGALNLAYLSGMPRLLRAVRLVLELFAD